MVVPIICSVFPRNNMYFFANMSDMIGRSIRIPPGIRNSGFFLRKPKTANEKA